MSVTESNESRTYQGMLEEVEAIVKGIGDDRVDLDQMVERIEHGYGLIKTMRARLENTKMKIENLRDKFTEPS